MDQKTKARERSFYYKDKILSVLKAGPLSAMDIHAALHENSISIASVVQYLRAMALSGDIFRYGWNRHRGADVYTIWAATKRKTTEIIDLTLKTGKGIDANDIKWMKYWRLPSAERRKIACGNYANE